MKKVVHKQEPLLAHLVEEEAKRNEAMRARYENILSALPKGKPYIRRVGGKGKPQRAYVYLSRRIPGRKHPESKYIGLKDSDEVKQIFKQLEDRGKLEARLASLEIERRMIEKALHEYRRSR